MNKILTDLDALQIYLGLNTGDMAPLERFALGLPVEARSWFGCSDGERDAILKLLRQLLQSPRTLPYAKTIAEKLPAEFLIESRGVREPSLLQLLMEATDEDWALAQYRRIIDEVDAEDYSFELIAFVIQGAYRTGKYALLREVYMLALACDLPLDNPLMDGWHPLCFAARIGDTLLAQAYLDAMNSIGYYRLGGDSLLIPPGWRDDEDDDLPPDYNTTILEEIALSKSVTVMALVLDQGGEVNARNRDGKTLLDVATDPEMIRLLESRGGVHSTRQEQVLFAASRSLQQAEGQPWSLCSEEDYRDSCLRMVMQFKKPLFRMEVRFSNRSPQDHHCVDLLQEMVDTGHIQHLGWLYREVRDQLDDSYNFRLLKNLFGEGPFGELFIFDLDLEHTLNTLKILRREGLRTKHTERNKTIAELAIYELLDYSYRESDLDGVMLAQFCRELCKITAQRPLSVVSKVCSSMTWLKGSPTEAVLAQTRSILEQYND